MFKRMVPEEGLEPSHTHVRQILSLLRLPFRHSGRKYTGYNEKIRVTGDLGSTLYLITPISEKTGKDENNG